MLKIIEVQYLALNLPRDRRFFIFIIVLMSLALIGLMVIQVYWIKNTITVRQAIFTRSINDVASEVIFKLEKNEITKELKKKLDAYYSSPSVYYSGDSIKQQLLEELQEVSDRAELENFFNRYFLARNLIENMLFSRSYQAIENRVDIHLLDSLIHDELNEKDIHTQYDFGVFSSLRNKMLIKSKNADVRILLEKGFAFALFPSSIVTQSDYLVLYFPREINFLIRQMWGMLSLAIALILIIILSFTYTVLTIFRQKKLSEMKNDFINNMTHEFKTPVSTISLACQALHDADFHKSQDIYDRYIKIINEENNRLGVMAEKILQTAILDKGQLKLYVELFDIHDVIIDVVKKIGIQVEIKDGKIRTDFHADPSEVLADKIHITNVISNLLDNANKYTPHKPLIKISTHSTKKGVTISIQDNGIGISWSNQKKIFDKRYRVGSGDIHDFKGFGLGLSYVKAIIDEHGGTINLESELKKGTKFDVFLPYNSIKS